MMLVFASHQLIPVRMRFRSRRTKARMERPMWFLCARGDLALLQRPIAPPVGVDQAVALEARHPRPAVGAHRLEVLQRGVPGVEEHALGLEPAHVGALQEVTEVVVLG